MVFSGITFLFYFLPLFFLAYYFTPKHYKNLTFFVGSVIFYAWGAPKFVFVLLASTYVDFHVVKQLYKAKESMVKKRWLTISIILNLGLLMYFKYANFFVDNVNEVLLKLGLSEVGWTSVALPIGISFYTFQTLTYSIDVFRNTHKPLQKVTDYMLYIMMFPQLIAGPIVRFHEIADQITDRVVNDKTLIIGFNRFCLGLAKKVLIANQLAVVANQYMEVSLASNSGEAWLGILAYTLQIYYDFAGYSDMAIGLGFMLGFKFPENFNSPYISVSITEFWRRWHMSLGRFMKDYLYLPLGGNRVGLAATYRNLFIVFVLSGLWHGASWNFVLWGVFHGSFLVIERLTGLHKSNAFKALRIPVTFLIALLGWVIFRIESFDVAMNYYATMFAFDGGIPIEIFNHKFVFILVLALLFSFIGLTRKGRQLIESVSQFDPTHRQISIQFILAIVLFVLSTSYLATGAFNPFIYFRF